MTNHFDRLAELFTRFTWIYSQWAKKQQLTPNELAVLYHINRYGRCTPTEISEKRSLPNQTVTSVCKQLDAKGLLEFSVDARDKRGKIIELSAHGRAVVVPMLAVLAQAELATSMAFGDDKFLQFLSALEELQNLFITHLHSDGTLGQHTDENTDD